MIVRFLVAFLVASASCTAYITSTRPKSSLLSMNIGKNPVSINERTVNNIKFMGKLGVTIPGTISLTQSNAYTLILVHFNYINHLNRL